MSDILLITTSTERLQPLGSAAQRSYELISGTLLDRLGPEYGALIGEPVANEAGNRIDWYASVQGEATAMPDLAAPDRDALRQTLTVMIDRIRAEAAILEQSAAPEDLRLSEALRNATEVPEEAMIFGIRGEGGTWVPVLVHWAWVSSEQASVRGVLTGLAPGTLGSAPLVNTLDKGRSARRSGLVWWWLILLGWLLLAALLGAILYLMIAPCGVNRFGLVYCPAEQADIRDEFEETGVLNDRIALLQRELAISDRFCKPRIPITPATPVTPAIPAFPVPSTPQVDESRTKEDRTEEDRAEIEEKITGRGAAIGGLNFVLEWQGKDDIDLYVTCPAGETISFSNREGCGGRYDLDANVAAVSAILDPVENIVFENPAPGLYKVRAHLRDDRSGGTRNVTLHVLRTGRTSQSYSGTIKPGQSEWTVNISISR